MSKHKPSRDAVKAAQRRKQTRLLISITSALILLVAGWLWWDTEVEDTDLAAIGQGENVIVQVHDPG